MVLVCFPYTELSPANRNGKKSRHRTSSSVFAQRAPATSAWRRGRGSAASRFAIRATPASRNALFANLAVVWRPLAAAARSTRGPYSAGTRCSCR